MPQNDGAVVIQIMGDNSEFAKTLRAANDQVRNFSNELSLIERSLQLNPGNVELLGQKFDALGGQITATRDKLNELKAAEQEVTQKFADGEIGTEQYNAFRREILDTEAALRDLITAQNDMFDDNGNLRDTTREMENLGDAIDSAGNSTVTFGDLLKANILSEYVREGVNKLAGAFGDFVKKGVDLASDLQEVQNVVDTTFDSNASKIYAWSDAALESFGISSLAAQEYNGTMGAMLKSMGLADDAILEMSTSLTGLSGDMASFRNLKVDEAFEKIRAGISGETEPLKQLGINMSVANLEAYALAQGIETAYDKMSQSEQAVLRYNYLMSVTADAQGDFAKTSDSFANQQRILQLNIENLSATLGQTLLPHLNETITLINGKLPEVTPIIEKISGALGEMLEFLIDNHEAVLAFVGGLASISVAAAYPKIIASLNASLVKLKATLATINLSTVGAVAGIAALITAAVALKDYIDDAAEEITIAAPMDGISQSCYAAIDAMKQQKAEFEQLKSTMKETEAAETAQINNMQSLWKELQGYVDENGRVIASNERASEIIGLLNSNYDMNIGYINGQIQGYGDLADSMDGYIEKLRTEARIRNNQPIYDDAVKNVDQLKKQLSDLEAKEKELLTAFSAAEGNADVQGLFGTQISAIRNEKAELESAVAEYQVVIDDYENLFSDNSLHGTDYGIKSTAQLQAEEYAEKQAELTKKMLEARTKATEKMQTAWEKADHDYAVGSISSEQELYAEKKRIWEQYGDSSAKEHWKYFEELCKYDKDFAAEQKKLAEEKQKLAEKNAEEERKETQRQLEEQKKIVDEGLNDILSRYQQAYDDLEKKRQAYRNKLMSVGGDLFSVDVTEENGKKTTTYTVNNLEKQLQKMREYHKNIKELKKQGASEALLSEITSLGSEDSAQFAKYLSKMSDSEFAAINKLYNEKQDLADELSSDLYQGEAKKISDNMTAELEALATNSKDYGQTAAEQFAEGFIESISNNGADAADGYIDAFKSEFEDRAKEFEELFRDTNMAAEIKATVQAETAKYSYAAYTAPVSKEASAIQSGTPNRSADIDRLIEGINKPIQIVLDGRVIAEAVMQYNGEYKRRSGG